MNDSKHYCRVIEKKFNKPFFMAKKDYEDFEKSTKCWIYKKPYRESDVKVKDHDHITGKYR